MHSIFEVGRVVPPSARTTATSTRGIIIPSIIRLILWTPQISICCPRTSRRVAFRRKISVRSRFLTFLVRLVLERRVGQAIIVATSPL
jgi:hypothetical protein